jgi:hypothetical protein
MAKNTPIKGTLVLERDEVKVFTANIPCLQVIIVNYKDNTVSKLLRNLCVVHPLRKNVPLQPVKAVIVIDDNEPVALYSNVENIQIRLSEIGRFLTSVHDLEGDGVPQINLWELWDCKFDNEHYYIPEIAEPLRKLKF